MHLSPEDEALLTRCLSKAGCEEPGQCMLIPYSEFIRITGLSEEQGLHAWGLISKQTYPWQQRWRHAPSLESDESWVSTGDKHMDGCLGGGLRLGSVVEVVGESAAGKTQFCLQLAIAAQLPESAGGVDGDVVYISTEGAFPVSRLSSMVRAFVHRVCGDDRLGQSDAHVGRFLHRIQVAEFEDMETMLHALDYKVPGLLSQGNVRLVIVDSIAAHLRFNTADESSQQSNADFYRERAGHLVSMGARFKRWAQEYRCAFVCVNQVKDVFDTADAQQVVPLHRSSAQQLQQQQQQQQQNSSHDSLSLEGFSSTDTDLEFASMALSRKAPALGATWANIIDTRIMLYQRRGLAPGEIRRPVDGNGDVASSELPKHLFRTRRWLENAFSPWAPRSQCEVVLDDSGFHHASEER